MKFLLDTHTFIWLANEPEKLSRTAQSLIIDSSNQLFLSVGSVWEMAIKKQLGKLKLESSLPRLLSLQKEVNQIVFLPVTIDHAIYTESLPLYHKDPFDRLLIAQSLVEELTIIGLDTIFDRYKAPRVW